MKRSHIWIALAIVVTSVLTYLWVRRDTVPTGDEFLAAVQNRRWSDVYALGPRSWYEKKGISDESYAKLMEGISQGISQEAFASAFVREKGQDLPGERALMITFPDLPRQSYGDAAMLFWAMKTSSGWKYLAPNLPVFLNRFSSDDALARARRLALVMEDAGLEKIPVSKGNLAWTREKLLAFSEGRIQQNELSVAY